MAWRAVFQGEFRAGGPIFPKNAGLKPVLIIFRLNFNVQANTNSDRVGRMVAPIGVINFSLLNYIEQKF